jgi:hypothetical protein
LGSTIGCKDCQKIIKKLMTDLKWAMWESKEHRATPNKSSRYMVELPAARKERVGEMVGEGWLASGASRGWVWRRVIPGEGIPVRKDLWVGGIALEAQEDVRRRKNKGRASSPTTPTN